MTIYDKASWHIDAGENKENVINRFIIIMKFLSENDMLSEEGKEIFELGVDSEISLNEKMVNNDGSQFLEENIDKLTTNDIDNLILILKSITI